MNNYCVYNLCDGINNYYGYTDDMKERWRCHKKDKKRNCGWSSQKLDFDNTIITVIERGLIKEIAHIWEIYYIQNYECVNIVKYNFNRKEWRVKYNETHREEIKKYNDSNKEKRKEQYEENKEVILLKLREYQEKHKEKITIWKRSLWYCSACDCDVQKNNKAQHLKTKKHINNTNK